jgi:UDP-N-acetylglucosamine acyltransferase
MSTHTIHPTAIIDPKAEIGDQVSVGPYTIIEGEVFIDSGTQIGAHVYIDRYTHIGKNCRISPFTSIGTPPQDIRYKGEKTQVVIGDGNDIREYVTINRGTSGGGGSTTIGNQNLIMAYCHVGHDCQLGNGIIMVNLSMLAGHVVLEDYSRLNAQVGVQQFIRVGAYAMVGAKSAVRKDILPYVLAEGDKAKLVRLNTIGLKRHDFSEEVINALKKTYQIVIRSHLTVQEALNRVEKEVPAFPEVRRFLDFIRNSQQGITR